MRFVLVCILLLALGEVKSQVFESFNSFNGTGEWSSPNGNTGSHAGQLCYNLSGNYLENEFYVFQSPVYDFSSYDEVEVSWYQESNIRSGDIFALYFYDSGWFYYNISNLNGNYLITVPNTTLAFAFVLNSTGGTGSLDNKYCHVDFIDIRNTAPLPVELLDFSVSVKETGNLIEWSTASEYQSDYFKVYKSFNGIDWNNLISIQAAGFATFLQKYKCFDDDLTEGYIYYRLEQTDIDGSTETFDPKYIYRDNSPVLKKYNILGQQVKQ